jgi:hypothetical protein
MIKYLGRRNRIQLLVISEYFSKIHFCRRFLIYLNHGFLGAFYARQSIFRKSHFISSRKLDSQEEWYVIPSTEIIVIVLFPH